MVIMVAFENCNETIVMGMVWFIFVINYDRFGVYFLALCTLWLVTMAPRRQTKDVEILYNIKPDIATWILGHL